MTEISFRLPSEQPELAAAVAQFITDEFHQQVKFVNENCPTEPHKDGSWADLAWQGVIIIATLEGSLQFAERVARMKRVKALLALIKAKGQAVYLKIGNKAPVDIATQTVDETMDLLANDEKTAQDDKEK